MNLSQWNPGKVKAIRKANQTINSTTNEGYRKVKQNSCVEYILNIEDLEDTNFFKKLSIFFCQKNSFFRES